MKITITSTSQSEQLSDDAARLRLIEIMNDAIYRGPLHDTSNFFESLENDIVMPAFANNEYMLVLMAVLIACQEELYFCSGYSPKQRICTQTGFHWPQVLKKVENLDLKTINIELS